MQSPLYDNLTYTPDAIRPEATPVIVLDGVGVTYDRREVLRDISFTVSRGDFIAITGPNGGGKTTLLRVILRLLRPTTGSVTYYGPDGTTPVRHLPIGYLPQKNMIDSSFPIDVRQVIDSGLEGVAGIDRATRAARVDAMLRRVDLAGHARKSIGQLSGGQLQRTLLGRALISDPGILVLDEPLSYLDKHFESELYDILRRMAPQTTVILVSHEMTAFGDMATHHLIVSGTLTRCSRSHHRYSDPCRQ